jgi:predicted metalloprotease
MRSRVAAVACGILVAVLATLVPTAAAHATPPRPLPTAPPACTSLEGCYGYADMQSFYDDIVAWIDEYSRATYEGISRPSYVYVEHGSTAPTACNVVLDSTAYAYCSLDGSVYVGQDQLWRFYDSLGDAAAALGIAHEWGHHVQAVAGITASNRTEAIEVENQADCIAGAWIGHLDAQGRLESDDIGDINAVLQVIGAAEGEERDHGTLAERTAALQQGFDGGIGACNAFFPQRPILS